MVMRPPLKAHKRDAFVNLKVQSAQPMLISHRPPLWGGLRQRGEHTTLYTLNRQQTESNQARLNCRGAEEEKTTK